MSDHAKYSPSAAMRWLSCTASLAMEPRFKETTSPAAEKGTILHEKAADFLLGKNIQIETEDLDEFILPYAEYISKFKLENEAIEQRVKVNESCWGTADYVSYNKNEVNVIDLKCGVRKVNPEENKQLMIYAIATLKQFFPFWEKRKIKIKLHIVQPAISNFSSWECSVEKLVELLHLIEKTQEDIENKKVRYEANPRNCFFCPHKIYCPEIKKINQRAFLEEIEVSNLSKKLKDLPLMKQYISEVEKEAMRQLENNKTIEGFKLAPTRALRCYKNDKKTLKKLNEKFKGYSFKDEKILSPAKLESFLRKNKLDFDLESEVEKVSKNLKIVEE